MTEENERLSKEGDALIDEIFDLRESRDAVVSELRKLKTLIEAALAAYPKEE